MILSEFTVGSPCCAIAQARTTLDGVTSASQSFFLFVVGLDIFDAGACPVLICANPHLARCFDLSAGRRKAQTIALVG